MSRRDKMFLEAISKTKTRHEGTKAPRLKVFVIISFCQVIPSSLGDFVAKWVFLRCPLEKSLIATNIWPRWSQVAFTISIRRCFPGYAAESHERSGQVVPYLIQSQNANPNLKNSTSR